MRRNSSATGTSMMMSRQVQDASYYMSLLKSKETAIEHEIISLKEDITSLEEERSTFKDRSDAYKKLSSDVESLERTMADFNVAIERERQGTDPEDLEVMVIDLKQQNDERTLEVDELFLENRQTQKNIVKVEDDISALYETIQTILKNTNEDAVNEYRRLAGELKQLKLEGKEVEAEIANLRMNLTECQNIASQRPDRTIKEQYDIETERTKVLKGSLKSLKEELSLARMGIDEAKAYLLERVKSDKKEISDLELQYQNIDDEFYRISNMERDVLDKISMEQQKALHRNENENTHSQDMDIYEQMYWKCEKANTFLTSSEEVLPRITNEVETKQQRIVELLKDLNNDIDKTKAPLPSHENFKALNADASYKAKHLANSELTMARLIQQKEKRIVEVR